jgi:hypothetical protein
MNDDWTYLFLLKGSMRIALDTAEPPIIDEGEQVQFELSYSTEPMSWRIRLGDLLPERPQGIDLGNVVRWERGPWFDSCRGKVLVSLERNADADADASPFGSEGWETVLRAPVLVRPSKITDDQWMAMRRLECAMARIAEQPHTVLRSFCRKDSYSAAPARRCCHQTDAVARARSAAARRVPTICRCSGTSVLGLRRGSGQRRPTNASARQVTQRLTRASRRGGDSGA